MEEYKDIKELLKPRRDIKASAELRNRVKHSMNKKRRNMTRRIWLLGGISIGAVAAILLLVLIPNGAQAMSPKEILRTTLNTLIGVDSFEMEVEVRTSANDNFSYIDPNADFVEHKICVENIDSVTNWRVDKGGRKAIHNNQGTYVWIEAINYGWYFPNPELNVLGYLYVFLSPTKTLESELHQSINDHNAQYTINKDEQNIYLTVHSLPQGDFTNPYMLNTSIAESECYRKYIIDANTRKLKSASVSIVTDGKEVEMIRLKNIRYGSHSNDITRLPSDIEFINLDTYVEPQGLPDVNAKEAASIVLNSFKNWNTDILGKVFDKAVLSSYKPEYYGAKVIGIGTPFKSGKDRSITYVPYTLKKSNGAIREFNLALCKNGNNSWIVTGGL